MSEEKALLGTTGGGREQLYRVQVTQAPKAGQKNQIRLSSQEYIVPYEQLSKKLQEINRQGGKVTNIITA